MNVRQSPGLSNEIGYTVDAARGQQAIAKPLTTHPARHEPSSDNLVVEQELLRRITPLEAERLQGLPDFYTAIPFRGREVAADSNRYKAIGNAMAVNCMNWIGARINIFEQIMRD